MSKTKKTAKTRKTTSRPRKSAKPVRSSSKGGRPVSAALVLGVAESMAQAAELLKCPEATLKQCKRAGAAGFRYSRVYFAEFIPWIFNRGIEDPNIDWADRLKRAQALREEVKLSKDKHSVIDRDEAEMDAMRALSMTIAELERIFTSELPASLLGQNENQIRARCDAEIARLTTNLRQRFERIAAKGERVESSEPEAKKEAA